MSIFDDLEKDTYSVFRDKGKLSLSYVPETLVSRSREETYFARVLVEGVRENDFPIAIRVTGPPGSGKTAVVRKVLEEYRTRRPEVFNYFYVNLKGSNTVFMGANKVLYAISGKTLASPRGINGVFSGIWEALGEVAVETPFVCLVLDEVESIFNDKHYDSSDFFYRFLRYRDFVDVDLKLCLIIISNELSTVENNLDARALSSLGPQAIHFSPYNTGDLQDIMKSRIMEAFKEDAFEEGLQDHFTRHLGIWCSDARKAISYLRLCGELANRRKTKITVAVCEEAVKELDKSNIADQLGNLRYRQLWVLTSLVHLFTREDRVYTSDLYQVHKRSELTIGDQKVNPLSERAMLDAVKYFESMGIIDTWNVSRGRKGYGKVMSINYNPDDLLQELVNKYHARFTSKPHIRDNM